MRGLKITFTAGISLVVSSMIWIGRISWVLIHLLHLSEQSAWILIGALCSLSVIAVGAILYEMRHAIELPASVDFDEMDTDEADFEEGLPAVDADWAAPLFRFPNKVF